VPAHTVIEVGHKDPAELFLTTREAHQSPPRSYLQVAFCFLWAAGQGKMLVPHPEPRK
jgi:hypothetical protein